LESQQQQQQQQKQALPCRMFLSKANTIDALAGGMAWSAMGVFRAQMTGRADAVLLGGLAWAFAYMVRCVMHNAYDDHEPDGGDEGLDVTVPALGLAGALLLYIALGTRADVRGLLPVVLVLAATSAMVFSA
jgi:hypothetical protein